MNQKGNKYYVLGPKNEWKMKMNKASWEKNTFVNVSERASIFFPIPPFYYTYIPIDKWAKAYAETLFKKVHIPQQCLH